MGRSSASLLLLLPVVVLAGVLVVVRYAPTPEGATVRGSPSCAPCHAAVYEAWRRSQHTRMMRPADAPGVVVADFDGDGDAARPRFGLEDAVWAIGGKWEQQFMGHDGHGDTLLPGAWLTIAGRWDLKGWDGWEVPVPLRRCHGCHTVGLDVETGAFVEPNIGCESCHGPGSWHVDTFGLGRIHAGIESEVCGQCHSRGSTPSGEFFFPVGYRPGDRLDDFFVQEEPTRGQTSSHWWGNGRPRKRHQEYPAWRRGGHAHSARLLGEGYDGRHGPVTDACSTCHIGEAALDRTVVDGSQGVTCAVCHNVHGALDEPRLACDACHRDGAFYHSPERNARHVQCPPHAGVTCVDCHMPKSVEIGGAYALRDHAPGIIPPGDKERWGTPTSCVNAACHATTPTPELDRVFTHFYENR